MITIKSDMAAHAICEPGDVTRYEFLLFPKGEYVLVAGSPGFTLYPYRIADAIRCANEIEAKGYPDVEPDHHYLSYVLGHSTNNIWTAAAMCLAVRGWENERSTNRDQKKN